LTATSRGLLSSPPKPPEPAKVPKSLISSLEAKAEEAKRARARTAAVSERTRRRGRLEGAPVPWPGSRFESMARDPVVEVGRFAVVSMAFTCSPWSWWCERGWCARLGWRPKSGQGRSWLPLRVLSTTNCSSVPAGRFADPEGPVPLRPPRPAISAEMSPPPQLPAEPFESYTTVSTLVKFVKSTVSVNGVIIGFKAGKMLVLNS
jgi:hypothetical protein